MSKTTRICYIHVGTHKTGTTSIQRFLALNRERFADAGVLLPSAGCDNSPDYVSHHQLAYELTASPNFDAQYGGLAALADELKRSAALVACLSSENLSLLWHYSAGLLRLRDTILGAGFTPKIVCYLRPQASFCTSVYAQIVCNGGYRTPFLEYLNDTLTRGRYVWSQSIGPAFDYEKLIDPFAAVFGRDSIIVSRYRSTAPDTTLLFEFGRLLLPCEDFAAFTIPQLRENGSLDFNTVLSFLGDRQRTRVRIKFAPLRIRQVLRFGSRFRSGNAAIAARYAVSIPPFELIDIALASPFRRSAAKTRALASARRALTRTRRIHAVDRQSARNTCFLHIGTHETTAALHRLLVADDRLCADAGVYIPRAGQTHEGSGHHNLAWELNNDERFDATRGAFADVLAEIAKAQAPCVWLSSEDFEFLHVRQEALRTLADGLNAIGYRPVVIIDLRPQADYAETLYAELVRHGLAVSFDAFLEAVIATGEYRFNDCRRFTFDYELLLDDFAAVFGPGRMVVRRYARANDVVRDFLRLTGVGDLRLQPSISGTQQSNSNPRCADVLRCLEKNAASGCTPDASTIASRMPRPAGRFDPVHLNEVRRIVARFNAGNKRVYEKYGVVIPCVSGPDLVADVASALGVDQASRYRKRCVEAHARRLCPADAGIPGAPSRLPARPIDRRDERIFAPHLARPALLEASIAITAVAVAWASLAFGTRNASTALVEFGMLSIIVAVSAAVLLVRYAVESRGVLADYQFFDDWGARLSVAGYALVGLYALLNACLDVGLARYQPDWISYPGAVAAAAAALMITAVQPLRKRLLGGISGSPIFAGMRDDRVYLAGCCIALFGQVAHAFVPDWWLDTLIDVLVVVFVSSKVHQIRASAELDNRRAAV